MSRVTFDQLETLNSMETPPTPLLNEALHQFRKAIGEDRVATAPSKCEGYLDLYAIDGEDNKGINGIVEPVSTEEVQAVIRIARQYRIPLWPTSRGKNLGYGGAEPLASGSIVLDLGRMNRILNVDERYAFCELEPGVSFFDLFDYLQKNKIALWTSIPSHGWGSVIGNALERGLGYTPYGNHSAKLCGLEVVLPDGSVIRTGMGAMKDAQCWHLYQPGFGPSVDQLFLQSNLGVVTRAGIWLMPEPEATLRTRINVPEIEDISALVDALAPLKLRRVIEHPVVIGNYLHEAAVLSRRSDWYRGGGALPDEVARTIMAKLGTGRWSLSVMHFGYPELIRAQADIVMRALAPVLNRDIKFELWRRGEAIEKSAAPIPGSEGLKVAKWHGGRGGHIDFSPVLPPDGKLVLKFAQKIMRRFEEFGLDYCASFILEDRHVMNINTILFDRDDPSMVGNARNLFRTLIADCASEGIGVYRTHIRFMEDVASTFTHNDHAMLKLNERIKKALDPEGILAPGKNGVGTGC